MTRRDWLAAALATPILQAQPSKPNIVYILADDLGIGDLQCYNADSRIRTPHSDRLAHEGMRFTDMHSPSAVCTPTRYGIMTGRYCWRTSLKEGVLWGYSPNLIEQGRLTVPSLLKKAGYHTAGIGKWHLGLGPAEKVDYEKPLRPGPVDHGFDSYFGIPASLDMDPYVYFRNDRTAEQPTATTTGQDQPRGVFWRPGPIAPGLKIDQVLPTLEQRAVNYLRDRPRDRQQPFFLYLPLTGPHTPWVPLKQYQGRSGAGIYGDFVMQVDATVGAVLKTLEETGFASDTIVILTSDNGAHWTPEDRGKYPHSANGSWRGQKADIHEAGHRVPFLVRWPGKVKAGSVSNETACLTDFLATAAEITGTRLPDDAGEDSFSILPALKGGKLKRAAVVHHSLSGMFAIREGHWKLIEGRGSGGFSQPQTIQPRAGEPSGELYNLRDDPGEAHNLFSDEPEIVSGLHHLLERYKSEGRSRPV